MVFPRKFTTDQSALEFLFCFLIITEDLPGKFALDNQNFIAFLFSIVNVRIIALPKRPAIALT